MKRREYKIILTILIILLLSINYNRLDSFVTKQISPEESIIVSRVIDGDTIVDSEGIHYRLLGVNTPEKGERLYLEAKKFLEKETLNKSLIVEKKGEDRYGRELAYIYDEKGKNINGEVIKEGYANFYFPSGKDRYYQIFYNNWKECIDSNENLCEKSADKCSLCIEIYDWNFEKQKITFYNKCNFDCNFNYWTLKDEGRKKFTFDNFTLKKLSYVNIIVEANKTDTVNNLYWGNEEYVWTSSGDTFFLRDDEGKLILWGSEGY